MCTTAPAHKHQHGIAEVFSRGVSHHCRCSGRPAWSPPHCTSCLGLGSVKAPYWSLCAKHGYHPEHKWRRAPTFLWESETESETDEAERWNSECTLSLVVMKRSAGKSQCLTKERLRPKPRCCGWWWWAPAWSPCSWTCKSETPPCPQTPADLHHAEPRTTRRPPDSHSCTHTHTQQVRGLMYNINK